MEEKHCKACNTTKSKTEFAKNKRQRDGLQSQCTPCRHKYRIEHVQGSPKEAARVRLYKDKMRERNRELKSNRPCADCGVIYPYYVMDFDHKHSKVSNVSSLVYLKNRYDEEVEKCDLVCSNCHRIRTFEAKHRFKANKL